ncbi:PilN domain-containing protein [Plesiomonas shigelloides]|uniref:PilN domain-containing protein n=1 Tax=Plesiomonas shigelloides TaxID=703 RepID=UPI0012627A76|nr:PilN domain-containing protein [Plesiomonas shigelloides]KAB7688912.1 pilus assembly protein PilN [Plesiomonas shigelloides]
MKGINLLPWRELERQQQQQRFVRQVAVWGGFWFLILAVVWFGIDQLNTHQQSRLSRLQSEIQLLDAKLAELRDIKAKEELVNKRITAVSALQKQRDQVTRLFNLLPLVVPTGVYIDKITLNGERVEIAGRSESNVRLSSMVRQVESSYWLDGVSIDAIVANKNGTQFDEFKMRFQLLADMKQKLGEIKG